MRIAFRGRGAGNFNIHLDNIRIEGTYDPSGVNEVTAASFSVWSEKGAIVVDGIATEADVYDMSGRKVAVLTASDARAEVPAGIYLVSCGGETVKVLVK